MYNIKTWVRDENQLEKFDIFFIWCEHFSVWKYTKTNEILFAYVESVAIGWLGRFFSVTITTLHPEDSPRNSWKINPLVGHGWSLESGELCFWVGGGAAKNLQMLSLSEIFKTQMLKHLT